MIKIIKEQEKTSTVEREELTNSVKEIIMNVENDGDNALRMYQKKFDNVESKDLKVTNDELIAAERRLPETLKDDIKYSVERIKQFAKAQRDSIVEFEQEMIPGVILGQKIIPIESIGAYVPGGRYPLLSSAQMSIVPARVAGVKNISVCTPPAFNGEIHPAVLYASHISGADNIFKVGGAHAIAALAHGTESINEVDKITGPGNQFVTEAKRQVNGKVGIDLLAGPSEILVLADNRANPKYVASDLLAQSEHDINAQAILVTTSIDFANNVIAEIEEQLKTLKTSDVAAESWQRRGRVLVVDDIAEAINVTNDLAPEHLHLHLENAKELLDEFINYGSIFLGELSSVVYADKLSGTNHILPTDKAAKYTGGVWAGTFLKVVTFQEINKEGVGTLAPYCVRQSENEGLHGHLRSANIRNTNRID